MNLTTSARAMTKASIVALGIYLSYIVLRPFLVALTWAVIFAILFRRMQVALVPKVGPNRAALVTTLVVAGAVMLPAVVLLSAFAHEIPRANDYLNHTTQGTPVQLQRAWDTVRSHIPVAVPENPMEVFAKGQQRALNFLAPRVGGFVADFFGTLGNLVAMLFALFFFVRDGDVLSRQLRERLPFSEIENERLMADTRDLVAASVGASLVVAAAQGAIGGLAFWLLGLGRPVFWTVVIGFCSLLPVVGAAIVWVPAAIGLLLSGEIGRGVLMALVGVFGISMVDNILRPLLLSGQTSISGFVIFFGLLGGMAAFGLIGLVIGPIILVITSHVLNESLSLN